MDMARKLLFFVPDNPLSAFISTGVLARCLKDDEKLVCHIYATKQTAAFFENLPAKKVMHIRGEAGGFSDWLRIMRACMGKYWFRVIDGYKGRYGSFLWARHRYYFFLPEHLYSLPDPVRPNRRVTGCLWVNPAVESPLPENLPDDVPVVVFAPEEGYRARWTGRDYAELAWRLLGHDGPFAGGHLVVMGAARAHQGMQDIAANLPAGQVSLIEDASVSARAALMRRATMLVGTDRLAARMAWVAAVRHIVRLEAREEETAVPYNLHAGTDVATLAEILSEMHAKATTNALPFANQR